MILNELFFTDARVENICNASLKINIFIYIHKKTAHKALNFYQQIVVAYSNSFSISFVNGMELND